MKTKAQTYKSEIKSAIHQSATDLYDAGLLDKKTMRSFDESCLTPIELFAPSDIKELREREQVSQDILAHHLNVSKDAVSQWERGTKRPAGPTLKLLTLAKRKGLASIA